MPGEISEVKYLPVNNDTILQYLLDQLADLEFSEALTPPALDSLEEDLEALSQAASEQGVSEGFVVLRIVSAHTGHWVALTYGYSIEEDDVISIDEYMGIDAGTALNVEETNETDVINPTFDIPVEALYRTKAYVSLLEQGTNPLHYLLNRPE
jgi:hypothetical protein